MADARDPITSRYVGYEPVTMLSQSLSLREDARVRRQDRMGPQSGGHHPPLDERREEPLLDDLAILAARSNLQMLRGDEGVLEPVDLPQRYP